MTGIVSTRTALLLAFLAGVAAAPGAGRGEDLSVSAAAWRADVPFPLFLPVWLEAWAQMDAQGTSMDWAHERHPLGGYLHVYVRNRSAAAVDVTDVLLDGISLARAVAFHKEERAGHRPASIHFAGLPKADLDRLLAAGEPMWWKADPWSIPAGGFAEVTIRLRRAPGAKDLAVKVVAGAASAEARVNVSQPQPRMMGICFSAGLDQAFLYVRRPDGVAGAPAKVLVDGEDVTGRSTIGYDPSVDLAPIVVRLVGPLAKASFHCFQAVYADGSCATAGTRAWADEIVYGMWGYTNPAGTPEQNARLSLTDMSRHNIDVHMASMGNWGPFITSEAGFDFLDSIGMRMMTDGPGNTRNPVCYFLMDEPDAHDHSVDQLPVHQRLGALAQGLVEHSRTLRRNDPVTPHLLNIDNTYKPDNWYTYAQLPDVLCADPYYQEQQSIVYGARPGWLACFVKPDYVLGAATICHSAAAPKPVHIILNAVRHRQKDRPFRMATPPEKRIELFYALAAGAKGISYWWYCPYDDFYGVGGSDPDAAALWKEIGLLGAEVRTAGPLIMRSCPATVPTKASKYLWVRSLLSGLDALLLVVVNDNHANDRTGTVIYPVHKASITVTPPSWLPVKDVFEVTHEGTRDVRWETAGSQLSLDLGTVEVTRWLVLAADSQWRATLAELYKTRFATNVATLLAPTKP